MPLSPALCRKFFRVIAVVEAITWAGLLVGMLFKYVVADDERGVQVFGPLHGAAFVLYVVSVLLVSRALGWRPLLTLVALACSIPPFASLVLELWAERTGRLRLPAERDGDQRPTGAPVGARPGA